MGGVIHLLFTQEKEAVLVKNLEQTSCVYLNSVYQVNLKVLTPKLDLFSAKKCWDLPPFGRP